MVDTVHGLCIISACSIVTEHGCETVSTMLLVASFSVMVLQDCNFQWTESRSSQLIKECSKDSLGNLVPLQSSLKDLDLFPYRSMNYQNPSLHIFKTMKIISIMIATATMVMPTTMMQTVMMVRIVIRVKSPKEEKENLFSQSVFKFSIHYVVMIMIIFDIKHIN